MSTSVPKRHDLVERITAADVPFFFKQALYVAERDPRLFGAIRAQGAFHVLARLVAAAAANGVFHAQGVCRVGLHPHENGVQRSLVRGERADVRVGVFVPVRPEYGGIKAVGRVVAEINRHNSPVITLFTIS